jgi:aspartate 1-decarboxylase
MLRQMLSGKIHRATVTETHLQYEGSIAIDRKLMEAAGMLPGELVHILNVTTGSRMETYVIEGEPGSGTISLNGAAARWGQAGDEVIIVSYALCDAKEARRSRPRIVTVDKHNRIVRKRNRIVRKRKR